VIDSYDLVHAYAAHARANSGTLREYSQAVDGSIHGEGTSGDGRRFWRVNVLAADGQRECICARAVINAAGLHADGINRAFLNDSSFDIMPRMGEFAVLAGSSLQVPLKHIILPFPSQRTKGVLLTPTLSGHVLIGPTAVDVAERDARAARCDESTAQHLIQFAREKLRVRSCETVVSTYAGLRPATQHQDYVIRAHADKLWVTVAGIRSTGVSASLGIAEYTVQLLQSVLGPLQVSLCSVPCRPPPQSHPSWLTPFPPEKARYFPTANTHIWLFLPGCGHTSAPSCAAAACWR